MQRFLFKKQSMIFARILFTYSRFSLVQPQFPPSHESISFQNETSPLRSLLCPVMARLPESTVRDKETLATLMCSWSWAWCCRVKFSCCFWNSAIKSCFWICCCCWMRSNSCCSCFSRTTGSTTGIIILRSVLRSKGEMGSRPTGTSDFTSTGETKKKRKGDRGQKISTLIWKQIRSERHYTLLDFFQCTNKFSSVFLQR